MSDTAKFFNTAGPIQEDDHYFIPISQRIDLPEILTLIDQKKYFVLHAPRQSGTYGETVPGQSASVQKVVLELKIGHKGKARPLAEGLTQIKMYLDRVGETAGHLLIFDRDPERSWDEKIYREEHTFEGCPITVWGM